MSHLLYLHSFPWGRSPANAPLGGPGVSPTFKTPGLRRKALSPMGLGLPVLQAYAPRFEKAGAGEWLALLVKDEGPLVLPPARVVELAQSLQRVATLEAPKLRCGRRDLEDFAQAFADELLDPVSAIAKKGGLGLYAEWC